MNATYTCRCSNPQPATAEHPGCARCGGERKPVVVWREDVSESDRPPPRTEPPRHAEAAALELYRRVFSRPPARRRGRFHTRSIFVGALFLAAAALVYHFDWDLSLLRLGSIALGCFGLISLLKGLLGHGPR